MEKRKKASPPPGVPPALKSAFCSLPEIIEIDIESGVGYLWPPHELDAICILAEATTGLEKCAESIRSNDKCPIRGEDGTDSGSLDSVWGDIRKNWQVIQRKFWPQDRWGFRRRVNCSFRAWPDEQDWRWLIVDVIVKAAAPGGAAGESLDAAGGVGLYQAMAWNARNLDELLSMVPRHDGVPGYSHKVTSKIDELINKGFFDELSAFAEVCDIEMGDDGIDPKLPEPRAAHTAFFQSVATYLKQNEANGVEIAPLKPAHLVAFAKVLIPGVAEMIDRDGKEEDLRREAARKLQDYGPQETTS